MTIRRAGAADAEVVADIYLSSRDAAPMPVSIHPPDDVRGYVRDVLLRTHEVWLLADHGLLALEGGDLHWLFVRPGSQGRGVGATLLDFAKNQRPGGLALWVFTSNTPAIDFYARHGFREVRRTDGDNEEGAPDIRLVWGDHPEGDAVTPRMVQAPDGVELAVFESGDPAATTVVLMHGYPDHHTVWDGVAGVLVASHHVVVYDVRGTGTSDKPGATSAYRMPHLVADLAAVIDAVSPAQPVHLLAHDWGSIQAWAAVVDERLAGRVASLTSISGPSLDYAGVWLRQAHRHPRAVLRQLAHSYYVGLFQVPVLPELAARRGVLDRATRTPQRKRSTRAVAGEPARDEADKINGIALYRANMRRLPNPVRTSIPVQVIVPADDAFVTAELAVGCAEPWVDDLTVRHVAGGHWIVSQRPDVIARLFTEFVDGPRTHPLGHGKLAGKLVLVTGGARGIGRSTALEFARHGADVIIADVDDGAAEATVGELGGLGVRGWSEHLDVSDAAAWDTVAAKVHAERGVPDIVVNNAGIGMGGPFLATSEADWRRIVDINLWGVIHGSRHFAALLVERGQGGHLVNVASAAAFAPSVTLPAYATTKAAVLMLTECLRAELAREGIGVTAVCPGFIDTDITRSTTYVGVDEATQDELRDSAAKAYRRRGYGPDRVARQIVRAVLANAPLAVITPEAKLLRAVGRFTPRLARRFARVDLGALSRNR